jgi:methoxymalonate biosynthesis protein
VVKCVIFDLDDTLWDGILAEDGKITLKPEMREILSALDERGILLSIASNGDPGLASAKLEELGLSPLFLFPQINDLPKREKLSAIMEKLKAGPDAVLFIDDDPFALAEAKYFFPGMDVRPADRYLTLRDLTGDKDGPVSEESRRRREMILSGEKSREALEGFKGTYGEFLATLKQVLTVGPAGESEFPRVLELSGRTNRINNFGLSTDPDTVRGFFASRGRSAYTARLGDRFGDYGIIGACLTERDGATVVFRLFCVSCRVESRGIAVVFLKSVIGLVQREHPGLERIECRYTAGPRNAKVPVVLKMLGFSKTRTVPDGAVYELKMPRSYRYPPYIEVRETL